MGSTPSREHGDSSESGARTNIARARASGEMSSVVELGELEEVKGLIARGEQVGVLSYVEIATATA